MSTKSEILVELPTPDGSYGIYDPLHKRRVIIDVRDGQVKISRSDLGTVLKAFPEGREIVRKREVVNPTSPDTGLDETVQE